MNKLKQLREQLGLKQKDISKELNISQPAVSQIETDPNYAKKFRDYLKILVKHGADINQVFK